MCAENKQSRMVKRETLVNLFIRKWCMACGKVTDMVPIKTGLPGILAQKCPCGMNYQANFLEDEDELVTIPDHFILPETQI